MSDPVIQINDKALKKLIKAFKGAIPQIRVGIMAGKAGRKDGSSNAAIGAKHEYGGDGMPIRSFLRMPLSEHLNQKLEASGAFKEVTLREVIRLGSILPWCQKLAITAEGVVQEAFATGGFGKWKPSDMRFKKNHQTLVESQQLRDSITSEVI